MPYKDTVQIKGEILGGTFDAVRSFVYDERTNDVGLCNMMVRFMKDNPSVMKVTNIKTLESRPYDWEEEMFGLGSPPEDKED